VHVVLERWELRPRRRSRRHRHTITQADVTTDAEGRAAVDLHGAATAGSYRVRLHASSEGRDVSDTAFVWVPGRLDGELSDGDQYLELIADRREYQPGDTARLVVRGAEFDATVLVTKESQFVSYHQVVKARRNEAIDVPIGDQDGGDVYVSIAFLKDDRLYRAERRLSVPAVKHRLTVTATADRGIVRPGEPGVYSLRVVDAAGAPVRAQLSVGDRGRGAVCRAARHHAPSRCGSSTGASTTR
jgi:uncharacterized protein YfaS (alpha-2-macroglobulin family)